jgi:ABC-type nitrate/sulfonate/bicarbonate transport system substrate-binding protein
MNRRTFAGATAGLAVSAGPGMLAAQSLEHYAAAGTPIEGDSLIFLAQSEGYFAKVGIALDVQTLSTGEDIAAALASGSIQIGGSNTMSLAIAHQNGIDLKAIAGGVMYLSSHSGSLMMVAKSSPVTSGAGLNGKIMATNVLHGSAQISSEAWVDKTGGDSKTVRWVEMPFSLMEAALLAGRIDAALITQPFATTALATCRSLGSPNDAIAPRYLNGCYCATQTWLNTHRDAARRISSALSKAAHWYDTEPAGSVQAVAALTKQDPAVVAKSVRSIFGETVEPALLQPVIDVGARYGLLKRSFPASEIIAKL